MRVAQLPPCIVLLVALIGAARPAYAEPDAGSSARATLEAARLDAEQGKSTEALRSAQQALEAAIRERDAETMRESRELVVRLLDEIPHVTFIAPQGVSDLKVTFDGRPVPIESLGKKFSVDPGKHRIHAEGAQDGARAVFDETIEVAPRSVFTVRIVLARDASFPACATCVERACLSQVKTQAEVQACLKQGEPRQGCRACLVAPARDASAPMFLAAASILAYCIRRRARAR